jgi:hypothetical protein
MIWGARSLSASTVRAGGVSNLLVEHGEGGEGDGGVGFLEQMDTLKVCVDRERDSPVGSHQLPPARLPPEHMSSPPILLLLIRVLLDLGYFKTAFSLFNLDGI